MALDTRLSTQGRDAALIGLGPELNNGYLRFYSGTRPATPNTALSGNTLLAELRFAATAFTGSPISSGGGPITAAAITDDSSADATGTATFARLLKSDGSTVVMDLEVGTSGANINMNSVAIQAGARVSITSFTVALPMQGA